MKTLEIPLSGGGHFPTSTASLLRPERHQQLKNFNSFPSLIARGGGKSLGDAALNVRQHVVLTERLNRFLSFEESTGFLKAEAGVTIQEILDIFLPRGWCLPVLPSTTAATLGGCVATDVWGLNHLLAGSIGKHIRNIELITADGTVSLCSPKNNGELFWSTVGGLGLTGIISDITIQLIPVETLYYHFHQIPTGDLHTTLTTLLQTSNHHHAWAWIDLSRRGKQFGRGMVTHAEPVMLKTLPSSIQEPLQFSKRKPRSLSSTCPWRLQTLATVRWYNHYYHTLKARKGPHTFLGDIRLLFLGDLQRYPQPFFKQHPRLQYTVVFPTAKAEEGMRHLFEEWEKSHRLISNAFLYRLGKEGEGLLAFPKEGIGITLDLPLSELSLLSFLNQMDEIVLKYEGRVCLVNSPHLDAGLFREMYPQFQRWKRMKNFIDPYNRFGSDLFRRLKMEKE